MLLICGATGTLGQAFARACAARGIRHLLADRALLDLERAGDLGAILDRLRPWGVVNAAGWVRVDEAEDQEAACHRINAAGAIALARACSARGIAYAGFSSDLVFDGNTARPYVESDPACPLNAYGRSKAAMEAGCGELPGVVVIRTAAFFSARDTHNFAWAVADALAQGRSFAAAHDHVVSPTFVPALVDASLDLLIDRTQGIWHLAGSEAVTWSEFGERIASACGLDTRLLAPVAGAELGWQALRPHYGALSSERGPMPGSLATFIDDFARDFGEMRRRAA